MEVSSSMQTGVLSVQDNARFMFVASALKTTTLYVLWQYYLCCVFLVVQFYMEKYLPKYAVVGHVIGSCDSGI